MGNKEIKNTRSYLDRLKQQSLLQENYGGEIRYEKAKMQVLDCPECGAGRAFSDGLTRCAYCGFKFMEVSLSDGIHIKKINNA